MRDVGRDVKKSSKAVMKLSDTVQGMMNQWTEEQFPMFKETMDLIRENAPVQYARLYIEAVKMGIVKQTDINVNINRQRDRDDLQALVRTRVSIPDISTYTPFEEIKPQPLPAKEEEEL